MQRTLITLSFVNGFSVGSKHQKFSALAPANFLYRLPNSKGAGPVLMKYFHTLGTFPTGLEIPIRIGEFEQTYLREHVPLEVEEWLACFIRRPVDSISINVAAAIAAMEACAKPVPALHRRALPMQGVLEAVSPVQLAFAEVGIDVPAVAVRFAVQRPQLRKQLIGCLGEWASVVREQGSTPHRRLAARQAMMGGAMELEDDMEPGQRSLADEASSSSPALPASSTSSDAAELLTFQQDPTTAKGLSLLRAAVSPNQGSAPDERLVLEAVTVMAEAAQREARHDLAERLLRDGLRLAHDEETEGFARANYSCALTGCGRYGEAEAEAREAVLLSRRPQAYASWSVAVAYQDDMDRAAEILEEGLQAHPGDATLEAASANLSRAMTGKLATPEHARGLRSHGVQAERSALPLAIGKYYHNPTDAQRIGGRLVHSTLDPTSAGLGQQVRRTGSHGGVTTNLESY
jgi:Tfp pilus assembly protein PilF